jgi:hypothetical protein
MNAKTVVLGLLLAFVIFYVMTSPDHAATVVHATWRLATNVAHGIGNFLNDLT